MSTLDEVVDQTRIDIKHALQRLASSSPVERERARRELVKAGSVCVIPLIRELKSPLPHVRWEAAKSLGFIKDVNSASALAESLNDRSHDVRWVAAEALIALGRPGLEQG